MNINDIEKQIYELEKKKELLKRINSINTNDVNEIIYIKYIQLESVVNVAKEINEAGHRIKSNNSERKYSSNDVSAIICDKSVIKDKEIDSLAKELFNMHKKAVSKKYY